MKSLTKKIPVIVFVFTIIMCFAGILISGDVFILPKDISVYIGDTCISAEMISVRNKRVLVSAEEFLKFFETDLSYSLSSDTLTIKNYGDSLSVSVGSNIIKYKDNQETVSAAPEKINSRMYIPLREVAELLGCRVLWDSQFSKVTVGYLPKKNTMDETEVTDEHRYYKYNGTFNGFDIFGNGKEYICTEKVDISTEKCDAYADIINSFAKAAPNARTYAVMVPTSSEFYSAKDYKSDYTEKFRYIYSKLDRGVRGVNAVKPLSEHSDEYIYFNTDHHWTQLGAYYAYREFLSFEFDEIAEADTFKKESIDYFQGSFIEYTKNTNGYEYMLDSYDRLDMYYPSVEYTGDSYYDVDFEEYISPMRVINPNFKNYDSFLDGDYPVEVYKTDVKNNKKICIVKDSFGNAFAVWALNNYKEVYVVDYRRFNNYAGDKASYRNFKISDFYDNVRFDDLVIIGYPVTVASDAEIRALKAMAD